MNYSIGVALLGSALVASIACAEPFTYQGVLQEAGVAADGAYDIRFELYDSAGKNTQLGATLSFDDVAVSGGTFSVDLDFGSGMFDGSDRFLFIEVRDGASIGGYTGLLPAIAITATPEAQHAATADTVLNPQWTEAPGVLTYGDGDDRVFINRSSPIFPTEYFGVHGNTTGFVGMYVSGPADSKPYYGYSIDNQISAFTYVDPDTSDWVLVNNGSTALTSDSAQNLVVAGNAVADSFEFASPKTSYLSVPAAAFHAQDYANDYTMTADFDGVSIRNFGSGGLVAPVFLPHGAMITRMTVYCTDNSSSDMGFTLTRILHTGGHLFMLSSSTVGLSGSNLEVVTTPGSPIAVDNTTNSYYVRAAAFNWPNDFSLKLTSVVIEYTTTEAE